MKIAILSDIHGNLPALKSVLNYLKKYKIDQYIIPGDFITDCPNPNEVIKELKGLDAIIIRGNRENYILDEIDRNCNFWSDYMQFDSLNWTINEITPSNIMWIRELPESYIYKLDSFTSIKVVHGSPTSDRELIKIGNPKIEYYLNELKEDVLICGHTHTPLSLNFNGKYWVNPGSVGVSFNRDVEANFTILEYKDGSFNIYEKSSSYKITDLIESFKQKGLLHKNDVWGHLVVQSISDGVNRNIEFLDSIKSKDFPIPDNIWRREWEIWKEKFSLSVNLI